MLCKIREKHWIVSGWQNVHELSKIRCKIEQGKTLKPVETPTLP